MGGDTVQCDDYLLSLKQYQITTFYTLHPHIIHCISLEREKEY